MAAGCLFIFTSLNDSLEPCLSFATSSFPSIVNYSIIHFTVDQHSFQIVSAATYHFVYIVDVPISTLATLEGIKLLCLPAFAKVVSNVLSQLVISIIYVQARMISN